MEVNGSAEIHLQPMEKPTLLQVDAWGEPVNPGEVHAGAGSCLGPAELWRGAHTKAGFLVTL